jgi:hypothetical protein
MEGQKIKGIQELGKQMQQQLLGWVGVKLGQD